MTRRPGHSTHSAASGVPGKIAAGSGCRAGVMPELARSHPTE